MTDYGWLYGALGVMAIAWGLSLLFDLALWLARRIANAGRAIDAANRHPED